MILEIVIIPPAPTPQTALAMMKLAMLRARAHQTVATRNKNMVTMNGAFLPTASESPPSKGWQAVEVRRNAVDSQEALLLLPKYDVMTGWDDAMMVESKQATK